MANSGTVPDPDILIVGAGPTGAVAAKRFAQAGLKVVVLEQGDWPDYSKARAGHPDFELTAGRYWSGNPNRRQATADYPKDSDGIPAPKLLYRMSENSRRLLQFHLQRARDSLQAAGACETVIAPLIRETLAEMQ